MLRIAGFALLLAALGFAQEGSPVYIARSPEALCVISWQNIVTTLRSGAMKALGAQLSPGGPWGEHATPGPPYLEPGNVVVDMPLQASREF
jgi:hypothetical protein